MASEQAPGPLHELEALLQQAFRRQEALAGDAPAEALAAIHVSGNDRLTPAEQVDLYRRQYWLRHVDSLVEDYPGLQALLGEEGFEDFCRAYLDAFPPDAPSLRDLGSRIVRFAEGHVGFPEDRAEAALQMVRYEASFVDIFDGADPPPLDGAKVAAMPPEAWETTRVVLSPLLRLHRLTHPVHRFRAAVKDDVDLAVPEPRTSLVALFRHDLVIRYEEMEPTAFALLERLASGEALVPACDALASGLSPEDAEALGAKVGPWFQTWTSRGWIIDVVPIGP